MFKSQCEHFIGQKKKKNGFKKPVPHYVSRISHFISKSYLNFSTLFSMTDFYNISVVAVTSTKEPKPRMVNNSMARYNLVIGCDESKDAEVR